MNHKISDHWQFWVDRGGTFTDIVALQPNGVLVTRKLLSENPDRYGDATLQGLQEILGESVLEPDGACILKMGTTVGTNALLERKGESCVFVTTKGFGDALLIGYQNRPDLFARNIVRPDPLYQSVIEIHQRHSAGGDEIIPLDVAQARQKLQQAFDGGFRSCAIVFMHGYRFHEHEKRVGQLAREIGFRQVSMSHEVSPLMKLISRGDTTVVDAYLSPVLRRYVDQLAGKLKGVLLMFMQSHGGLTEARCLQGKDSILSGPAGGIVGAVETSRQAGFHKIITFDMGGTSTDVSHYAGHYERSFNTEVAGVRICSPMLRIHTIAAGGGSILHFDGWKYQVGPDSAGANPGPACYGRGGPLTITDCNVMLGKLQPDLFPQIFGPRGDKPIDRSIVQEKFSRLAHKIKEATGDTRTIHQVAQGFLDIAVDHMAHAIKKISVQRGYNITEYTLCCFGGAGGQHACLVADALGVDRVLIHPYAGVLSAYGMGLADIRSLQEESVESLLSDEDEKGRGLRERVAELEAKVRGAVSKQGVPDEHISVEPQVHIRYEGTNSTIHVPFGVSSIRTEFESLHRRRFGFTMPQRNIIVEAIVVEAVGKSVVLSERTSKSSIQREPIGRKRIFTGGEFCDANIYRRENLVSGEIVKGPVIVVESTGTTIVEMDWQLEVTPENHILLTRLAPRSLHRKVMGTTDVDPVMLEVFNNLFMSIAEQMGVALENTACSVNIKERLDFSCAVFDARGGLVANAPHMPVHLGSMGESVRAMMKCHKGQMQPGDAYILNNPYNGGTHLPDITVVTPVFGADGKEALFYVASRGHHADVGGITPGSMPPDSSVIHEEGVLIDNVQLMDCGTLLEEDTKKLFTQGPYPARHVDQNMADIRAQLAANEKGLWELRAMVDHFGLSVVRSYMQHIQNHAEESIRQVLRGLKGGYFTYEMDDGCFIKVAISVDNKAGKAVVDFTGTSDQHPLGYNAPSSVVRAAVMYVFRTLVDDVIPMNEGCLKPIRIIIPEGCMLRPRYPAAVVAGNVETSQYVTDALYGALGVQAASQGTMNNFSFGDDRYQYYETICGGAGAGKGFSGCDAVHTHMTNSKLTDPEILEQRFPVRLESFEIRRGSGGAGRFRGGHGTIRKLRFLKPMTAAILSGHRRVPPYGLAGGKPGTPGRNSVVRVNGATKRLGSADKVEMQKGDLFVVETPGGGGYGQP